MKLISWWKPHNQPLYLSDVLSLSVIHFHFLFLHVTLFAVFFIPPTLRSHYSAVELCNGARGYQLNEFCPVASIYCTPSQMKLTVCACESNLAAYLPNINRGFHVIQRLVQSFLQVYNMQIIFSAKYNERKILRLYFFCRTQKICFGEFW